jgi:hypothetical protein
MTPIDLAARARSREPVWDDSRSGRVKDAVLRRRRPTRRSLALDVGVVVLAGACLALLFAQVSSGSTPDESRAGEPPAVALADGAPGDGG